MRRLLGGAVVGTVLAAALWLPAVDAGAQVPPFPPFPPFPPPVTVPVTGLGAAGGCGTAGIGTVSSGDNTGNEIAVGDTYGDVDVDGGTSTNDTDRSRSARRCGPFGGNFPF